MTETQWLITAKPAEMFDYVLSLSGKFPASERKLNLFLKAYCQRFKPSLYRERMPGWPHQEPVITCLAEVILSLMNSCDESVCCLYRDIFGNPFRPVRLDHSWLHWNGGTIVKLAQTIYDDRRFDDLPILADALEEAGCTETAILEHCRGPGPHVRGCWVVDLLLGRT